MNIAKQCLVSIRRYKILRDSKLLLVIDWFSFLLMNWRKKAHTANILR